MEVETEKTLDFNFWAKIKYCILEKDFMIAMMAITNLFVVITGI